MKSKNLMLGAAALGVLAGQVGAGERVEAGLSLDHPPAMGERVATCRGGPIRGKEEKRFKILCPDPPNGLYDDRETASRVKLAVKKTTKKVAAKYRQVIPVDLDKYAAGLSGVKLAVKKTTKKVAAS
jgi:hypothetical protein